MSEVFNSLIDHLSHTYSLIKVNILSSTISIQIS